MGNEVKKYRWRLLSGTHRANRVNNPMGWEKVGKEEKEPGRLKRFLVFRKGDVARVPANVELDPRRWKCLEARDASGAIEVNEPQPKVKLQIVKSGRWFNVVNPETGKQLNDKGLAVDKAIELAGIDYKEESKVEPKGEDDPDA